MKREQIGFGGDHPTVTHYESTRDTRTPAALLSTGATADLTFQYTAPSLQAQVGKLCSDGARLPQPDLADARDCAPLHSDDDLRRYGAGAEPDR